MNKVTVHFFKGNTLVRTEICFDEFEAETLVQEELKLGLYSNAAIVVGNIDDIIR